MYIIVIIKPFTRNLVEDPELPTLWVDPRFPYSLSVLPSPPSTASIAADRQVTAEGGLIWNGSVPHNSWRRLWLSFPIVDQNASAESKVRYKPGGLDPSACNHNLDGPGIGKRLDQRFGGYF